MEKQKYYIAGGFILTAGLAFLLLSGRKRKKLLTGFDEVEEKSILETQPVKYGSIFPLRMGSGYDSYTVKSMVKNVQRYINTYNIPLVRPLIIDGIFGEDTEYQLFKAIGKKEVSKEDYQTMIG